MSEVERRFHEEWLGMVQPVDGLVVSIPVLVDKQCMHRHGPELQYRLREACSVAEGQRAAIADLDRFLAKVLELEDDAFDRGDALPEELKLWVPEGKQTLQPTMALRHIDPPPALPDDDPEVTPAMRAGRPYVALVWDLAADNPSGVGLSLDKAEDVTGAWHYPPAAKFERLLRHVRVPIGILTNRSEVRLVYAPHGESDGSITFKLDEMLATGGRPILDAFVMLLHRTRWFGVAADQALPAILAESRKRQAEVTNALADQVFEALELLLRGFETAAERQKDAALRQALLGAQEQVYGGLLTVLLRLVFMLYAEDRGLLPVDHPTYAANYSVLGLFERLQADAGSHPDAMSRRFGAWSQLVATWRTIFMGVEHGSLHMPPRRGQIFDPNAYPFLEGRTDGGTSPIHFGMYEARAGTQVPRIDDETVYRILERLLFLDRQRLSYRALDVEQIGSVYEALMGYSVKELAGRAVALRPQRAKKVWVCAADMLAVGKAQRAKWLQEEMGLVKAQAEKIAKAVDPAKTEVDALEILAGFRMKGTDVREPGRLVIQPGHERRRTSSHYTPRSLTIPIVRTTLEPLLAVMGPEPKSDLLLELKICDPAMGSGAFLVEVVRQLGDQVVAAWTREGALDKVASVHHDAVMHARRLVAQRCVYGVDKNPFAVQLAKLSLWLVTLAKDLPFTFVDHALRWGDSLVGLSFDQITAFHWKPESQVSIFETELKAALDEAVELRREICDLAEREDAAAVRERERLLRDADDAVERVRIDADLVVGAFFECEKDKAREAERKRRLELVGGWLADGGGVLPVGLAEMRAKVLERVPTFHWMIEFPEVFFLERRDPLDGGRLNEAAHFDAVLSNPPFLGGKRVSSELGANYGDWLEVVHQASGNADLSAHFFRRADGLLGSHGTLGLIATNTISQGDTRAASLRHLLSHRNYSVYRAVRDMPWPETAANVTVCIVHLARGTVATCIPAPRIETYEDADASHTTVSTARTPTIQVQSASHINSRLRATPERPDPLPLPDNADLAFIGTYLLGTGFVLSPEERAQLIGADARNSQRIRPLMGGEELNTDPDQTPARYAIDFSQLSLEEAQAWPMLLRVVEERVKPEREQLRDNTDGRKYKELWWRFARSARRLTEILPSAERCVVAAAVSKHLMFSLVSARPLYSHKTVVFPYDSPTLFGVLQSRAHAVWAWTLSSTMKTDLNYSPSDVAATFPFPQRCPWEVVSSIEQAALLLHHERRRYMARSRRGLTQTYNMLASQSANEPVEAERLRQAHVALDRAVLDAYGLHGLDIPPYAVPSDVRGKQEVQRFEDRVLDHLLALNEQRAERSHV